MEKQRTTEENKANAEYETREKKKNCSKGQDEAGENKVPVVVAAGGGRGGNGAGTEGRAEQGRARQGEAGGGIPSVKAQVILQRVHRPYCNQEHEVQVTRGLRDTPE